MGIKSTRPRSYGAMFAVLLLVSCGNDVDRDIVEFAVIEPIRVEVPRNVDTSDSFANNRLNALTLYADGDYSNSRTPFAHALYVQPDHLELRLYFGSALMLGGDFGPAVPSLARAATADDPIIREEAFWQLANAQLALRHESEARDALASVIDMGGLHASDARRLLEAFH